MRLLKTLAVLLGLSKPEAVVPVYKGPETRLERFSAEYEFYKNTEGYRNNLPTSYNITAAKKINIETFSASIKGMLDALDAIEKALSDKNTPNRKALRVVADSISQQKNRRLVDYMMTNDFYVYPDAVMGELLERRMLSVLTTMEQIQETEREGRFAFFIRFVDPLLEDSLTLLRVLREHFD